MLISVFLSQILTIETNGTMAIAKLDFLQNSTTPLSSLMNKNDVTHLINQNQNFHVLILIFWGVKNTFFTKKYFFEILS